MGQYDNCPCRYCEKRYAGCHAECPEKAEWDAARKKVRDFIEQDKLRDMTATGVLVDGVNKRKRRWQR